MKLFSLKQEKESQDNPTEATGLAPWSVTVLIILYNTIITLWTINKKWIDKNPNLVIERLGEI